MASNFPTSLDSLSNPNSGDSLTSPSHSDQHADANDAIEALQAKVGANSSAVTTSHDYKITQLETNSVSKTLLDAKGQLFASSAASTVVKVDAGSNDAVLVADSTQTPGVKWATTLAGLTLTAPTISTISNSGTLTLPTGTRTLVARDTTDTLTNKTVNLTSNTLTGTKAQFDTACSDDNFAYLGQANAFTASQTVTGTITARAASTQDSVILQGRAGGTSTRGVTITPTTLTASRTFTLPDATTTAVGTDVTQTLTNKTIALGTNTVSGTLAQFNTAVTDADLVSIAGTETLTNKTLTAPLISSIVNTGTLTLPTQTDTLVGRATTDTLTNKSIALGNNTVTGTLAEFNSAVTDADFASLSGTEILTNKTIGLNNNTVSGTLAQFNTAVTDADLVSLAGAETLTNKTLTAPVISTISNTGTITLPTSTDTLVGRATTDTLTNKTIALGSNTVSGTLAQFNTAVTDADLVSLAGAETLTNKTIALGSNTVSGTLAQFNTAVTDADFASIAGTETLTNKTLTSPTVNTPTISGGTNTTPILVSPEERWTISATAATGTVNVDVSTTAAWLYTANASANWTFNFRGNIGTTLSSLLATGDSVTIAFAVTNGNPAYYPTAFQIDGSAITPKWQGGAAPTAGSISSIDLYVFTIVKTAATPTYTVLAAQTKFA